MASRSALRERSFRSFRLFVSIAAAVAPVLAASGTARAGTQAVTWSFAVGRNATCPGAVSTAAGKIVVDVSALPKGAKVFRAVLRCARTDVRPHINVNDSMVVVPSDAPEEPLALLPPGYTSLDATAAAARAVEAGRTKLEFQVKSMRGWQRDQTRLDVSFLGGKARNDVPKLTGLTARHHQGQTILTWKEIDPPTTAETITIKQYRQLREDMDKQRQIRYRVYRSSRPITAAGMAGAVPVAEVAPLSCWNHNYHGVHGRYGKDLEVEMSRHVVEAGQAATGASAALQIQPVAPGTGICAHNPAEAGKAWYAVTAAIDGEEDLAKAAVIGPIEEKPGPGPFVLQRVVEAAKFHYVEGTTLKYYVRWESPPRCNLPGTPYDYLVAVPPKVQKPAPVQVAMHCWGGTLNGGYGSWHGGRGGAMLIATNQIPYDWWISYHEHRGTFRPWSEGLCRDFTVKRVLAFLDWVQAHWEVDATRIYLKGASMGGAGACMTAIRYPQRFAFALSEVGVHNAAQSPQFRGSYEGVVGQVQHKLRHESGLSVWDYLNDSFLLRQDPARDVPLLCVGNGKEDHGIGWPQALEFAQACQQTRQPHTFGWGLGGHTAPVYGPPPGLRLGQSVPAFTRCSLDSDPGTAKRLEKPKEYQEGKWLRKDLYDGEPYGQLNGYLTWDTDTIVDEKDRWEMTVHLLETSRRKLPKDSCTVDVTPRRCRKFKPRPGEKFKWTNSSLADKKVAASGTVTADEWGLVTLEQVTVTKAEHRLKITKAD